MKKLFTYSFFVLWYSLILYVCIASDLSLSILTHEHPADFSYQVQKTDSQQFIKGAFTAHNDHLGMIYLRFAMFKRPLNDQVIFELQEKSTGKVILRTPRGSADLLGVPMFPFGFTPQTKSKGVEYMFTIRSQNRGTVNAIKLSTTKPVILTKYQFPKSHLLKNPLVLMQFLFQKISYAILTNKILLIFLVLPILLYPLLEPFKRYIKLLEKSMKSFQKRPFLLKYSFKRFSKYVYFLSEIRIPKQALHIIFACSIAISFIAKIAVATLGFNADMESWKLVADIARAGDAVYNHTHRYNYGPVWYYIMGGLSYITSIFATPTTQNLHIAVVAFLSLVDISIGYILKRMYGIVPAILFLLSPIAILLTGFHSQFDNLAVLIALVGWGTYIGSIRTKSRFHYFISALIFGLSLSTKHILIFFPIWLMLTKRTWEKWKMRMIFFGIIYATFLSGFVFEILKHLPESDSIIRGITANVFGYKGSYGQSSFMYLLDLLFPVSNLNDMFLWVPVFKGYTFLFFAATVLWGIVLTREGKTGKYLLPWYLLIFFAFSAGLADQYMAIPLISIAIFSTHPIMPIVTLLGYTYLSVGGSANIANLSSYRMYLGIGSLILPFFPWSTSLFLRNFQVQSWLILYAFLYRFSIFQNRRISSFIEKISLFSMASISSLSILFIFIFVFLKWTDIHRSKIVIRSASYGSNCSFFLKGNITESAKKQCDGMQSCTYVLDAEDPAALCNKDIVVKWSCDNGYLVEPVYFVKSTQASRGTSVKISCKM